MKSLRSLPLSALPLLVVPLLNGCFTDSGKDSSTVTVDGMTVTNDSSDLSNRVTQKNDTIQLDTVNIGASAKRAASAKTLTMTLTAEIASPVIDGDTLQATSVYLFGGFAYVSYNMQGEKYRGGVDVVQIKSGSNAELRSQVLFDSTDVHALTYGQQSGVLYLAEGQAGTGSAAMVEKLEVNGGKIVAKARQRTPLSSFAANAVTASGSKVWVTTGSAGRLYTLDADLKKTDSTAVLADARWVDYDGTRLVVAQGTPCRLSVFGLVNLLAPAGIEVKGCDIAESKTTVRSFGKGKALVAAGDSGVRIVNVLNGTVIGSAPRIKLAGFDSTQTVTNAADGSGTLVYASNGEAGIYALEASSSLEDVPAGSVSLTTLGKLKFPNFQSANHVAFDGNTLVVAAGKGGVKIVAVKWQ